MYALNNLIHLHKEVFLKKKILIFGTIIDIIVDYIIETSVY